MYEGEKHMLTRIANLNSEKGHSKTLSKHQPKLTNAMRFYEYQTENCWLNSAQGS